jgi:hypothetical protein
LPMARSLPGGRHLWRCGINVVARRPIACRLKQS